jgi:hypothetical protein
MLSFFFFFFFCELHVAELNSPTIQEHNKVKPHTKQQQKTSPSCNQVQYKKVQKEGGFVIYHL